MSGDCEMTPGRVRRTVVYARANLACRTCGAAPGQPCTEPGPGREVCGPRFVGAIIALKREAKAARRTPEQTAILAQLSCVPEEEIEACRLPNGCFSFTRERLARWGVPWPPPAGWLSAIRRDEDGKA